MKNQLSQIVSLVLLLLPLLGGAQEIQISGRVVDAQTKTPIPFVSLNLLGKDVGALCDEAGNFQIISLAVPKKDSLLAVTRGYKPRVTAIEMYTRNDLLIELSPIDKSSKNPAAESVVIMGMPGNQYAFYIGNIRQQSLGKLRAISFYTGYGGIPDEEFRLRLYKADGPNHSPKTDILFEPVVINEFKAGAWITVDLLEFDIAFPDEGFYLALEYLAGTGGPNSVLYLPSLPSSGAIVSPSGTGKECGIWVRGIGHWKPGIGKYKEYDKDWILDEWTLKPLSWGEYHRFSNMIKVEADCAK